MTYLKYLTGFGALFQTSPLTLQSLEPALETLWLEVLLKTITSFRDRDNTC